MSWCSTPPKKTYPMVYKYPIAERVLVGSGAPEYTIDVQPLRLIFFCLRPYGDPLIPESCTRAYCCEDCMRAGLPGVQIPITEDDWQERLSEHGRLHQDMLQWVQMILREK